MILKPYGMLFWLNIGIFRWVGLGEGMRSDHMVWRHTCSVIDFKAILIVNVISISTIFNQS